jgi:hypothetical protein
MAARHNTSTDAPDPRGSAYWDLNETLAWIVYRSERAIRAERLRWRLLAAPRPDETAKAQGRRGQPLSVWNTTPLLFRREGGEAFAQLKHHLETAAVYADGRRELFGERRSIPPLEWSDLSCSVMSANPPAAALRIMFDDSDMRYGVAAPEPAWRDVRFRVADIIKAFPPKAAHAPEPPASAPRSEPEFPDNLTGRVARELQEKHPDGRWGKVEVMRTDLAGEGGPSCSRRVFENALALLAKMDPERWPRLRKPR